jgi:D-alanyl-D-alanine carboxypeptidase (penicillin-binding protein 5/6)
MRKRWVSALTALALTAALAQPVSAASVEITAPSAILIDAATGTVLYEENAHERLAPASVTKVMTLLLVMEALDDGRIGWDDVVTTSAAAAAKGGSQIYLEENEQLPLREMLKSVVVSSANDCATALAEHVAGSESAFVDRMNARAAELGMTDTHFVNCTGLDDEPDAAEHLTCAYDIAVMSRELLRHDEIREYTTIWMDTVRNGQFGLSNTNKLVRFYSGTTGLKTGYTSAAGYCLSASAERDGLELIAVVLHCATSTDRFESAKALLDYGFANYCLITPSPDEALPEIPVVLGTEATVRAVLADDTPILADKGAASGLEKTVELASSVTAPVEAGQKLGTLVLRSDGTPLAQIDLVAETAVPRLSWWQLTVQLLRAVCLS